jgi:hypothetical protein
MLQPGSTLEGSENDKLAGVQGKLDGQFEPEVESESSVDDPDSE